MQPNPQQTERARAGTCLYRSGTAIALVVVIEILVVLMGFASRFAVILQTLAAVAGVTLVAVIVNLVTSRKADSVGPESDQMQLRQLFSLRQWLLLGVLLVAAITMSLPIWHRHGDYVGHMHGHPIWEEHHLH